MLILSRKADEKIVIGGNIQITIVEVSSNRVKVGIVAPKDVAIDREEIHDKKKAA